MFEPGGLRERYARLVGWEGRWVNYWTQTVPRAKEARGKLEVKREQEEEEELTVENDLALSHLGMPPAYVETDISAHGQPISSMSSLSIASPTTSSVSSQDMLKSETKTLEKERRQAEKDSKKLAQQRGKEHRQAEKELATLAKRRAKDEKGKKGRHFIVLPTGLGQVLGGGEKWEKVLIGAVENEVAAHTGLFIRNQNLDYEDLVKRVGETILAWCEGLSVRTAAMSSSP